MLGLKRPPLLSGEVREAFLNELEEPYSVALLLRAERVYHLQLLDNDVRVSKLFLAFSITAGVVNVGLSLLSTWYGIWLPVLTIIAMLGRRAYEQRRSVPYAEHSPAERSVLLLGGVGALPVSYLALVAKDLATTPSLRRRVTSLDEEEYAVAATVSKLQRRYEEEARLSKDEAEIYLLLKSENFAGDLEELVNTARRLAV